jgi:hypothetical protein
MKIRLISHASVVIETADAKIWTDPWLFGKAFNDSWALMPEPDFDPALYDEIDFVWVSHEHPDHFHFPTLKSLPADFKRRVTLLFQKNNSDKMPNAFRALGFDNVQLLPNREIVPITQSTEVYCAQIGNMDSSLGVRSTGETVFNLNDCEANDADCRIIRRDLSDIHTVLNQFSIAGYRGHHDYQPRLTGMASRILDNLLDNHRALGAAVTIPFASFVYFCTEDNRFINEFMNSPRDVHEKLTRNGERAAILYPGDIYDTGSEHSCTAALEKFDRLYADDTARLYDRGPRIELQKIKDAFDARHLQLHERFPSVLLRFLKPMVAQVRDLDTKIRFCLSSGAFEVVPADTPEDLVLDSQPLHFAFQFPWGIQTLLVSGRVIIKKNFSVWNAYKIVTTLNNAEVYLKPRYLFTGGNLAFFLSRFKGGLNQTFYKLKRMSS